MADADGATEISDFDQLWVRLKDAEVKREDGRSYGIAVGSRAHLEKESKAKRAFYRTVLMKGMHLCVAILCPTDVKDTQCGPCCASTDLAPSAPRCQRLIMRILPAPMHLTFLRFCCLHAIPYRRQDSNSSPEQRRRASSRICTSSDGHSTLS